MAVKDIDILVGSESLKEDWVKDPHDLNEGAGGDFLYLAWVTKGTDDPITDIYVVEGEGAEAPRGYHKIDKDLNKGAGGKYLYLCFSRKGTRPILDFTVVAGDSDKVPAPAGFTRYDQDLNAGAKGKFIYICYKQQA